MYELLDAPFELARELEGHPDNVAAALHGGFVICAGEIVRLEPLPGLEAVLAVPAGEVATPAARAAMPAEVLLADAVHNVAHASLLVLGLARDDFSLIGRGFATGSTSRGAGGSIRARWSWSSERTSSAPWAPRSRGRACCSVSPGSRPALVERLRAEAPDCDARRVMFVPGGADVREL